MRRKGPQRSGFVVNAALFFLSVTLTCMGVGRLVPPPEYFREKLEYFLQHKDEFDLLFFGASETHWGVSPEIFDDQLSKHGIALRSFNLAVPGSSGYEVDHMIRYVRDRHPKRWRYAIITWRTWRLEREEMIHERQIWWHSFTETLLLFNGLWMDRTSPREKLGEARNHAEDALRNFVHMGLGPELLRSFFDRVGPGRGKWDYLARTGGFEGLAPDTAARFWPQGVELRQKFLTQQQDFLKRTVEVAGEMKARQARSGESIAPYMRTLFPRTVYSTELQVEFLNQNGVEPIYLIPPSHEDDEVQTQLWKEGYLPRLLAFNDPWVYPILFELGYRYDNLHLTEEGAQIYSRFLADRFAEIVESETPESSGGKPAAQTSE